MPPYFPSPVLRGRVREGALRHSVIRYSSLPALSLSNGIRHSSFVIRHLVFLSLFTLTRAALAQRPQVPVPIFETGLNSFPTDETIPAATLAEMDRAELGKKFDPALAPKLPAAHELIERYFQSRTAAGRKAAVEGLEATKIDANLLGRICRIRAHWPALNGGGVFYVNQKIGAYGIQYFAGLPKAYDRSKAWPLVIKLPSAAAFLTEPALDAKRVIAIYTGWIQDELSKHSDALVLMPLANLDELWGPSYGGMNRVIQPLMDAANHLNIDPARVYVVGHADGAQGVWNVALHYPTYFAAINPLAGSANEDWQRMRLVNLSNMLPVVWHDDNDQVIKVGFSKSLVEELRKLKIPVDFDETHDVGHTPPPQIVESEYEKMRKVVRNLYPPQVQLQSNRPDAMFNRNDWIQVYQSIDGGREKRLFFPRSSAYMTVDEKGWAIKAQIQKNQIEALTDNVETLRFYLNDQMVDFSAPVTVIVDHKQRFKGLLKPGIDEMLRDQLFLGRGWRYYTAAIDLTLTDQPATTRPVTRPASQPARRGRIIVGP